MGRPGLLGMAARTAVVAGTATAVSGAVASRQQARAAAAEPHHEMPVPTPPPPPAMVVPDSSQEDLVAQIQQLAALHAQGILSAEEFALAKQRLLGI
ncbi:SHOCT domain-containing protein [Occultella kanbiaonis]|uniref:SHOCT domain-containing protein n=1 Tax=Occultella kanbiaonis TaxID=2675754 RepID=UPI0039A69B1F